MWRQSAPYIQNTLMVSVQLPAELAAGQCGPQVVTMDQRLSALCLLCQLVTRKCGSWLRSRYTVYCCTSSSFSKELAGLQPHTPMARPLPCVTTASQKFVCCI